MRPVALHGRFKSDFSSLITSYARTSQNSWSMLSALQRRSRSWTAVQIKILQETTTISSLKEVEERTGSEGKVIRAPPEEKTLKKKRTNCPSAYGEPILWKDYKICWKIVGNVHKSKKEYARRACTETFRSRTLKLDSIWNTKPIKQTD